MAYVKMEDVTKWLRGLATALHPEWIKAFYFAADKLAKLPAADVVERKGGEWIWDDEGYHCSECFFRAYGNALECMDGTYAYCPNCGADMRKGGES